MCSAKLLGFVIYDYVSWAPHLENVTSRIPKRVYLLLTLRQINAPMHIPLCSAYIAGTPSVVLCMSSYNIGHGSIKRLELIERRNSKIFNFFQQSIWKTFVLKMLLDWQRSSILIILSIEYLTPMQKFFL